MSSPNMDTFVVTAVIGTWKLVSAFWIRNQTLKRFEYAGKVSEIHLYPLKSCKSTRVENALCTVRGLKVGAIRDRSIMIVEMKDGTGHFVLMRNHPSMKLINISFDDDEHMTLTAPDMNPITLLLRPDEAATRLPCKIHGDIVTGEDYGQKAASWFSKYFKSDNIRLVHFSDDNTRTSGDITRAWPRQTSKDDIIAFTYMSAYLLANQKSLNDLNDRLENPLSINNFRPNIVIDAKKAFDEDDWVQLRIGNSVIMRCQDYCRRCVDTTISEAAIKDKNLEPLRTLKKFRQMPGYGDVPCFGVYAAADAEGRISTGDPVYVLRR